LLRQASLQNFGIKPTSKALAALETVRRFVSQSLSELGTKQITHLSNSSCSGFEELLQSVLG
jgi:hypothetical protein